MHVIDQPEEAQELQRELQFDDAVFILLLDDRHVFEMPDEPPPVGILARGWIEARISFAIVPILPFGAGGERIGSHVQIAAGAALKSPLLNRIKDESVRRDRDSEVQLKHAPRGTPSPRTVEDEGGGGIAVRKVLAVTVVGLSPSRARPRARIPLFVVRIQGPSSIVPIIKGQHDILVRPKFLRLDRAGIGDIVYSRQSAPFGPWTPRPPDHPSAESGRDHVHLYDRQGDEQHREP